MSRLHLPRRNLQIIYIAVLCSVAVTIVLTYQFAGRGKYAQRFDKEAIKAASEEERARMWESYVNATHPPTPKKHGKKSGHVHPKEVIGLMKKTFVEKDHETSAFSEKMVNRQVTLLVKEMTSNSTMLPTADPPPTCMGDRKRGEVEDLLCIPRPKYLSHTKNPCWYDQEGQEKTLKCLPYFHILGIAKSGTTDLWNRLMAHPHILSNKGLLHKEGLWWSWNRYGVFGYKRRNPLGFNWYVNIFKEAATQIQKSIDRESLYHQILITGDASPPDFWDFRGWRNISQNRGLEYPKVITPHLMRHMYRDPKFILIFKDPIERVYSDYFFVGGGLTSLDFHNDLLATLDMLASCVELLGLQKCFFDHKVYMRLPVRLPFACYSVWMREWLQVFPLDNFLFLKTEEYDAQPEETLRTVIDFLGLVPLKEKTLEDIAEEDRSRVTIQKQVAGPMKTETRAILSKLLQPCNEELARMVKMDKFLWNSSQIK